MASELPLVNLWKMNQTSINFDAGLAALDTVTSDQAQDFFEVEGDTPAEPVEEFRRRLAKDIAVLREQATTNSHTDLVTVATPDSRWQIWLTGGKSWGDSPGELYDAMDHLWLVPQILAAMGFSQPNAEVQTPVQAEAHSGQTVDDLTDAQAMNAIAGYMNAPGDVNGGDLCQFIENLLPRTGPPIFDHADRDPGE